MRPVDQTTFGVPGGNCFSACVASLLELRIEDVPYFMGDTPQDWDRNSGIRLNAFLSPLGLFSLCLIVPARQFESCPIYMILGGQAEREPGGPRTPHAVVGFAGKWVHDPHPSRAGLIEIEDVTLIVPIDPARRGQ